jgi:hypothetical protein
LRLDCRDGVACDTLFLQDRGKIGAMGDRVLVSRI